MMEKTSWVIAAVALAVAGCNAGPDMDPGAPAAEAGEAGSTPETAGQSQAAETKPEAAVPDDFKPFVDAGGSITQGRCHMDACSWMKWEKLEVVGDSGDGVELAGSVLGGVSDHSREDRGLPDYPDSADDVAIEWDPVPSAVSYWCSKTQPGMKWGDEPRVALALDPESFVPGAMESAVRSYFVACHSDLSTGPVDDAIVKYGYRVAGR
ncbi:hypothetical protein GCM10022229_01430 [Luteimonas lutimaris]|uniref:Uncharacterized protein n=2 Tax=Luteimonas lutimaris TaxID=698645 RepID=A0ABP7M4P5_9GAMM